MKERMYTKEEVMKIFEEAKELLKYEYEKTTDPKERNNRWNMYLGSCFATGVAEAMTNAYEKGWL